MAINANDYLGPWVDLLADDKTPANLQCVSVDTTKLTATFDDGRVISIIDLDTSGRYEHIRSWTTNPRVVGDLSAMGYNPQKKLSEQVAPSEILGDLSKIGHRKPENTGYARVEGSPEPPTQSTQPAASTITVEEARLDADPVAKFIDSAIQISRNTGKSTTIPVTIPLVIDFDIINVIKMSMQIGASDIEILQHIMRYISVPENMVKKLIAEELMSPADAAIVNEHREETFDQTIKEELERTDSETAEQHDIADTSIPDSEFHELN